MPGKGGPSRPSQPEQKPASVNLNIRLEHPWRQSSSELLVAAIAIAQAAGDLETALPDALAAAGIVDDETCNAIANQIGRIPHLYKRGLIT
jgi:hypothetical protein